MSAHGVICTRDAPGALLPTSTLPGVHGALLSIPTLPSAPGALLPISALHTYEYNPSKPNHVRSRPGWQSMRQV